jgi:hypothetical protein
VAPADFKKSPTGFYMAGQTPEEVCVYHRTCGDVGIVCFMSQSGNSHVFHDELSLHLYSEKFIDRIDQIDLKVGGLKKKEQKGDSFL